MDLRQNQLAGELSRFQASRIEEVYIGGCSTGFSRLDAHLGGGLMPGLIVLGAMSNIGKSTLALQMAETIALGGRPVLFYSLEMPAAQIAAKALSRRMFLDSGLRGSGCLSARELLNREIPKNWERINPAREFLERCGESLYVFTADSGPITTEGIVQTVQAFIADTGRRPAVFIDYLQILQPDASGTYRDNRAIADENIRRLIALSHTKGQELPVFLISSMNRASYDGPAVMQGFKDTSSIEYSADVLLGLQFQMQGRKNASFDIETEKSRSPRRMEIVTLKQRYGPSGKDVSVKLDYYSRYDYFRETELETDAPLRTDDYFYINNCSIANALRHGKYHCGTDRDNPADYNSYTWSGREGTRPGRFWISRQIDAYDCAILDAMTYFQHNRRQTVTARMVYRLLAGEPGSVSAGCQQEICRRIERLADTYLIIQYTDEGKKQGTAKDTDEDHVIEGYCLPVKKTDSGYAFVYGASLPLYTYVSMIRQVIRIPRELFRVMDPAKKRPLQNTTSNLLLKLELLRRIEIIRWGAAETRSRQNAARRGEQSVRYDTLFSDALNLKAETMEPAACQRKRKRYIASVQTILAHYAQIGYLEEYQEYSGEEGPEGVRILRVRDPEKLDFQSQTK